MNNLEEIMKKAMICKNDMELLENLIIFGAAIIETKKKVTDYEAYDAMHNADGIVGKSLSPSKL
jgi:hypothetical protein